MVSKVEFFQNLEQDQFTRDVVTAHNKYRAKHNAPPLKWSSKAAMAAQRWAEQLAKQNKLQGGDHEGMGQNLAYMSGKTMTGQEATAMWYNKVKDYDFNNPGFTPTTGHFTQVVWAGSTEIGVGRATSGGGTFVVANYYPPGNVRGRFEANVQASQHRPSENDETTQKESTTDHEASQALEDQFTHDVVTAHNQYRAKHNAQPLKWSSKAAVAAQRWAEQLAKQKKLQHGDHEGMGQNLAYMSGKPMTGQEATDMWYDEIKDYDFSNPKFTPGTGHFTQVVWIGSTEIGVGRATSGRQTFVVANYYPPGNFIGRFEANVQSTQRDPKQTTKSDRKVVSQKENNEQEPFAAQAQEPRLDQFIHDVVTAHNQYRTKHNAPPLKWSSKAATAAQRWAEQLAKQKKLQHGNHEGMGQNLAHMSGKPMTGQEATDLWYNEVKHYDFNNPGFSSTTGNFTQVVWAGSTEIGVGRATSGGRTFVVVNYYPPGNFSGHFEANVQASQHRPDKITQKENTTDHEASQVLEVKQDQFTHDVITAHNQYRAKHNAPPLKWSGKAATAAQRWAEQLAKQKKLQHGDHEGMGQNVASMSGKPMTGQEATDMWYNKVKNYDFNNPGFTPGTGNFTQVVWAGSTEIGIGRVTSGKQTFVVANYIPPGNVQGRFKENVQAAAE